MAIQAAAPNVPKQEPTDEVRIVAGRVIQTRAKRRGQKARIAIDGPTGSGKTYTALTVARELDADDQGILVIDTERGSASLYADDFTFATIDWQVPYDPTELANQLAESSPNFGVIVVDSLTHFWKGEGGVLNIVDAAKSRFRGNSYDAWSVGTPIYLHMIESLLSAKSHVIVTMRSKMAYEQAKDEKTGRTTITKLGLAPEQREGIEYEFAVLADMNLEHQITISKSRFAGIDKRLYQPGRAHELGRTIREWLATASDEATPAPKVTVEQAQTMIVEAFAKIPRPDAVAIVKRNGYTDTSVKVSDWVGTSEAVVLRALFRSLNLRFVISDEEPAEAQAPTNTQVVDLPAAAQPADDGGEPEGDDEGEEEEDTVASKREEMLAILKLLDNVPRLDWAQQHGYPTKPPRPTWADWVTSLPAGEMPKLLASLSAAATHEPASPMAGQS